MFLKRDQDAKVLCGPHPENIVLFDQWHVILSVLRLAHIDVIVLKGAALLETVYQDITFRPLSDLDLLFRGGDVEKVQKILSQHAFLPFPQSRTSYIKPGKIPIIIDIHMDLGFLEQEPLERIWGEALPATIASVPVLVLSHEHTILYLISHLVLSHGYPLAKWVQDIDVYIRKYEGWINWPLIIDRLKSNQLRVPAYYVFLRIQNIFQTPIPKEIMEILRPKNQFSLQAKIVQLAMHSERPIPYIDYILPVILKNGLGSKIKIIFTYLFPERFEMIKRYNISIPILVYPFYLVRWLNLSWKVIAGLAHITLQVINKIFNSGK